MKSHTFNGFYSNQQINNSDWRESDDADGTLSQLSLGCAASVRHFGDNFETSCLTSLKMKEVIIILVTKADLDFLSREIEEWKYSPKRLLQIKGFLYYDSEHDILRRKRTAIGKDGESCEVSNLPDNRIVNNLYGKMINQKTNYLLGKPFVANCENREYEKLLKSVFNAEFRRTLKSAGKAMMCGGIAWLYPFYDENGFFAFRLFPAYEILPFWKDNRHTVLDCAVRLYCVEMYEGATKKTIEKAELFTSDGVYRFTLEHGKLVPDTGVLECVPYLTENNSENATTLGWKVGEYAMPSIPLIPLKYGEGESPLLKRVKSLQDGINAMLSDFANNMQEDARNTILVLKNYDGEDLGEFRRNLAAYGAIKVRCDGDSSGGVDTLSIEVNADNYALILKTLKRALVENAMGYDSREERSGSNLNQLNIRSMYSDIDLDANDMETELQASFSQIMKFVNIHLLNTTSVDYSAEEVTFVFNRDILVNEAEAIEACVASKGILSEETIIEQHPWVNDVSKELKRLHPNG